MPLFRSWNNPQEAEKLKMNCRPQSSPVTVKEMKYLKRQEDLSASWKVRIYRDRVYCLIPKPFTERHHEI